MSEKQFLRTAKDGCGGTVKFGNINVYHNWFCGESYHLLGSKFEKDEWIINNVKNPKHIREVELALEDWELYKNGWFIKSYKNTHLLNYLCDIGTNSRPISLSYIKN